MSSLLTFSNAIRFTSSIIKDEFRDRKGATWKKNGIPIIVKPIITWTL